MSIVANRVRIVKGCPESGVGIFPRTRAGVVDIVPVLDIMGGVVVRAVGGRRDEYRPVVSRLTDSCDPLAVASAMSGATGAAELYVADLDAIRGRGTNAATVVGLPERCGVRMYVDSGWRDSSDDRRLPRHPRVIPVFGSETVCGPGELTGVGNTSPERAFSVDLRAGELVGRWAEWAAVGVTHSRAVAEMAIAGVAATGAATVLLIDVARVGTAAGPGLDDCRAVRAVLSNTIRLLVGGGVRNWDDIRRLGDAGADGVLVASALHDGRLP